MKLRPLQDNVIVKPIKVQNTTPSGIVMPDSATKADTHLIVAVVLAIGPGDQLANGEFQHIGFQVDDIVVFSAGTPVFPLKNSAIAKIDGSANIPETVMLHINYIMAVLDVTEAELLLESKENVLC